MLRWLLLTGFYAGFFFWYTNFEAPLTREEADAFLAQIRERGADPDRLAALTRFLYEDDGDDFVMVNLIDMRKSVYEQHRFKIRDSLIGDRNYFES